MITHQEVFKVAGKHEVRGFVASVDYEKEIFSVNFTDHGDYTYCEHFSFDDINKKVFEDEKTLLKFRGNDIVELAPPRIIELKAVKDFYGNGISEGDMVDAAAGETLYSNVKGAVKRVYRLSSVGFELQQFVDVKCEDGSEVNRIPSSFLLKREFPKECNNEVD